MSVNIKDSSRPNDLNPVSGRVPDNVYKYEDALSLEEISASTDLTNKIPTAEAVGKINTNLGNGEISFSVIDGEPYVKVGADAPRPFNNTPVKYLYRSINGNTSNSYSTTITESGLYLIYADAHADNSYNSSLSASVTGTKLIDDNFYGYYKGRSVCRLYIGLYKMEIGDTINITTSGTTYGTNAITVAKIDYQFTSSTDIYKTSTTNMPGGSGSYTYTGTGSYILCVGYIGSHGTYSLITEENLCNKYLYNDTISNLNGSCSVKILKLDSDNSVNISCGFVSEHYTRYAIAIYELN